MLTRHVVMKEGVPDDPDEDDLDAICRGPQPQLFFAMLFKEVANTALPDLATTSSEEDDVRRVETGWAGNQELGLEVTVVTCTEATAFPVYCYFQTHGLPGMTVKWNYELHYKGQLGHVIYRHGSVECTFDQDADQQRFAAVWRRAIGKDPVFVEAA